MISHKYKFIFVRIPKTASSSIISVLEKYDPDYIDGGHAEFGFYQTKFKREWKDYFKFTFVRNPWALRYSYYIYNKTAPGRGRIRKYANQLSFKDWVKRYLRKGSFGRSQMQHIGNVSNFDFIGRVENLQEDFNIVCDKIEIPHQELPHKNATKHKHYSEYYDDELKAIMERRYKKDIETFGYKFGE
jgi:chondroitin 4-sulfotransferase 11